MALLTAAEIRAHIPSLTGTTADSELATFLASAEQALASYCGFPPIGAASSPPQLEERAYTFYLSGPDEFQPQVLRLPLRPVLSVTSVYDDPDRAYGSSTEVEETTDFDLDKASGALVLTGTTSHAWSSSFRAIKVVANCGISTSYIPEYVKRALGLTTKALWDLRHQSQTATAQTGGDSTTYRFHPRSIPPEAAALIAPLVMWERRSSGGREAFIA